MAETSTKKLTETYTKKLTEAEYLGIFNLGAFFDGSEQARFAASKISEKIADAVRAGTREVVVLDEKNNPKLLADGSPETAQKAPESIEITLTRKELDGYYIGVKESLKKSEKIIPTPICSFGPDGRSPDFDADWFVDEWHAGRVTPAKAAPMACPRRRRREILLETVMESPSLVRFSVR